MEGKRAVLAFVLATAVSCTGASTTGGTATNAPAGTTAATAPGGAATSAPTAASTAAAGPAFRQILTAARATQYKVTYRITATGGAEAFSGEQSWYFKPPKARFDFTSDIGGSRTTVQLFALADGTYMCFSAGGQAQCLGGPMTDAALQQNSAAYFQDSLVDHPEQWDGVLVETRQIAGQQAHCYDVRALTAQAAGLTDGRFCYSTQGIPLLSRFTVQGGGSWSMEATSLSTNVPDSDFTLPATPTVIGRP